MWVRRRSNRYRYYASVYRYIYIFRRFYMADGRIVKIEEFNDVDSNAETYRVYSEKVPPDGIIHLTILNADGPTATDIQDAVETDLGYDTLL